MSLAAMSNHELGATTTSFAALEEYLTRSTTLTRPEVCRFLMNPPSVRDVIRDAATAEETTAHVGDALAETGGLTAAEGFDPDDELSESEKF